MARDQAITTLFLDIGGVLLTNGWDRNSRIKAAEVFELDFNVMDERHHLTFGTYEEGKLSLTEYLNRVVFNQRRPFSRGEFKEFMLAQSRPFPEMIDLVRSLKAEYGLKLTAISNEGRELTEYRIRTFRLNEFIDSFVSSCFVHFRKPDTDIFRIGMDISHTRPEEVVYIEDREMYIEVAEKMGIKGIRHTGLESTKIELESLGLFSVGSPPRR